MKITGETALSLEIADKNIPLEVVKLFSKNSQRDRPIESWDKYSNRHRQMTFKVSV